MSYKTVGSIVSDLSQKQPDSLDPIEIQRATEKEYLDELVWCVEHAQKKVPCDPEKKCPKGCEDRAGLDGNFFIEALTKKEKILANTLRNYFCARQSCPTPHFDQTVYRYNKEKEEVEFLWVVPDQETCEIFRENITKIVPNERALLKNVLEYYDGTLFRKAKEFNGETMKAGVTLEES